MLVWLAAAGLLTTYGANLHYHGPGLADEFVYLASAKRFAQERSLNACFYTTEEILSRGYPHQDDHAPGYVVILGSLFFFLPQGYWTAVALNIGAYLLGAWLVGDLARQLGGRAPWVASALFLVLPTTLAYVYWIMAELVLVALFLAALWTAARHGSRAIGAVGAGVLLGVAFLVRESALFGLPAAIALLPKRRAWMPFLAGFAAFTALVYAPLSVNRAPGGANFWEPTSGKAFGYEIVQSAREGRLAAAQAKLIERVATNWTELAASGMTEKTFLALFVAMPLWILCTWHHRTVREKSFYGALTAGWLLMVCLLFGIYAAGRWSGFRYLMVLMPAFLPAFDNPVPKSGAVVLRWWLPAAAVFVTGLAVLVPTARILDPFKATSAGSAILLAYIERYIGDAAPRAVLFRRGFCFGLARRPVEVIHTLPSTRAELRQLEAAVGFDYAIVSPGSPFREVLDGRLRYRLVNADDPTPPVRIYARLRRP